MYFAVSFGHDQERLFNGSVKCKQLIAHIREQCFKDFGDLLKKLKREKSEANAVSRFNSTSLVDCWMFCTKCFGSHSYALAIFLACWVENRALEEEDKTTRGEGKAKGKREGKGKRESKTKRKRRRKSKRGWRRRGTGTGNNWGRINLIFRISIVKYCSIRRSWILLFLTVIKNRRCIRITIAPAQQRYSDTQCMLFLHRLLKKLIWGRNSKTLSRRQ